MQALAAVVASFVTLPSSSPAFIGTSPMLGADLAAVTVRAIDRPVTLGLPVGAGLSLDSVARTPAPISNLILNTDPRSVAQAETSLAMVVTLRMR